MMRVPDAASLAAMRAGTAVLGRHVGGSTGTNLCGAFALIAEMLAAGRQGSVVTLICDGGERYADTYYSDTWIAGQGIILKPHLAAIDTFLATGVWQPA